MRLTVAEFQKWQRWAKEVEEDVTHCLVYPRQVFRHFADVVNANVRHIESHDGFVFVAFVQRAYVAQIAMGIRRHVKNSDKSVSLMRLLDQLRCSAAQFTYDFFLQQFPFDSSFVVHWQPGAFRLFSNDGQSISAAIVQEDMERLTTLGTQIEELADRTIAHLDIRGFSGLVTHGDLDNCINGIDQLVCKYRSLLTGKGMTTLNPTILYDWEKIFTVPLDIRDRG